ncbi:type II secretion system protein [Alcanivorax nanhaiticus]|uniref:Type II secretion system protein n=1 Tax=Alcanivorax nanhaiticus TaxID=1177154 RepID=A0A095SJ31_9GAMM|nr:CpaF family protein [Alcanivorax nanhaiticus]KGD64646.1 type II secretion system protein [Alcanivorax nanhaiticus]
MAGRIDAEYQQLKDRAHRWVVERLDEEGIEVSNANRELLSEFIRSAVGQHIALNRVPLSTQDLNQLVKDTLDEVLGFGPLEPLLADPRINDILVNGPDNVFIEVAGVLQKAQVRFINDDHVIRVIRRMLAPLGRRLDEASPMVDARLPDGSRVNAIIPPLALNGPSISIRKFTRNHLSAEEMIRSGSLTQACLDTLIKAVETRRNIIISGGTGTGKTTMLNLISQYIPREERILTIEDSAELVLNHPHVVSLETRPANTEGKGKVTARELVINSLRMRPDRVILGEVRSNEIIELLQAMNTGHEGSMSTIHANSTRDALVRIETLLAVSGYEASEKAIGRLIGSALDVIIQLERLPDGRRRVSEVVSLSPTEDEQYNLDYLYRSEA